MKNGTNVVARVTIQGGQWRATGWRYTLYRAERRGNNWVYKFCRALTDGMYPNKQNEAWSRKYEQSLKAMGLKLVHGRP